LTSVGKDSDAQLGFGGALLIAICHFTAYVDRAIPAVFAPALRAEFSLSDTEIGLLQGPAFVVAYAAVLLIVGTSRNRLPLAPLAAICMLGWTVACLFFALAADIETLMASRLMLGFAQAAFGPTALIILAASSPQDRLGRSTALFTAGSATGRSGAMIIGGGLLAVLSWSGWFGSVDPWRVAIILMTLPNLILAWWLWRRIRATGAPTPSRRGLRAAVRHIASTRALALHMGAGVAVILLIQAGAGWAPSVLNRSLHFAPATSAWVAGLVILIAAPAGHLTAGRWLDRNVAGRRRIAPVMTLGAALAVCGAALMASGDQAVLVLPGLFLLTAGGGAAALTALGGLAPITRPDMHGSVVSVYLAVCAVAGTGLGPVLTGLISDTFFPHAEGLARALFLTIAIAGALAIVLSLAGAEGWRRLATKSQNSH
jgi:MFS family permease